MYNDGVELKLWKANVHIAISLLTKDRPQYVHETSVTFMKQLVTSLDFHLTMIAH